jgi:hypothetical protein
MIAQQMLIPSLALALLAVPAGAGPIVYALAGNPQQFGRIDLSTGVFSPVGSVPGTIQYLVPGPNQSLLTMSFNGDLDAINPATGAISVIGPTGFNSCLSPQDVCDSHSELSLGVAGATIYTTDFANNLYTIDPTTGHATLIGPTGLPKLPFVPLTTNSDGSFDFYDENLFGAGGKLYANYDTARFNPATSVFTTVTAPALYQIDPATGHATPVSSTELGLITLTNVGGTIYGFNGVTNQIVTLNLTNGTTSVVSNITGVTGLVGGASPVPEPASIGLAGLGLLATFAVRRRTR